MPVPDIFVVDFYVILIYKNLRNKFAWFLAYFNMFSNTISHKYAFGMCKNAFAPWFEKNRP